MRGIGLENGGGGSCCLLCLFCHTCFKRYYKCCINYHFLQHYLQDTDSCRGGAHYISSHGVCSVVAKQLLTDKTPALLTRPGQDEAAFSPFVPLCTVSTIK